MVRWLFISFLVAHGLVHLAVWLAPATPGAKAPFNPAHSWLLGERRGLAVVVAALAAALYLVAGAALMAHAAWWRAVAVAGSGVSLTLITSYFHPWLSFGAGLDIALIAAVAWLDWPARALLGG